MLVTGMAYLIGITGGSGSGKTTFAKKILKSLPEQVHILHMDSYYVPNASFTAKTAEGKPNFDHPDSFDWELLRNHISALKNHQVIHQPIYDYVNNRRTDQTVAIGQTEVVIFEGIFSLYDQVIRDLLDIKCFLQVDSDIRFARRLSRDVKERGRSFESVIAQYYETVRPMYQKYLDPQRQHADFIVGEETDVAASILASKIKDILGQKEENSTIGRQAQL